MSCPTKGASALTRVCCKPCRLQCVSSQADCAARGAPVSPSRGGLLALARTLARWLTLACSQADRRAAGDGRGPVQESDGSWPASTPTVRDMAQRGQTAHVR